MEDPRSTPAARRARLTLGIVGCLTLLSIGWTGLLIPSLIRSIEATFGQTDAGIGVIYLVYAVTYMSGSFAGGSLTERFGRRLVLGGAVLLHAAGIAGFGLAPTWVAFVVAALVAGSGAGALDGGANGLVLDVYREGRGRAMNLLHVSFSAGALAAPLAVGLLVEAGLPWQSIAVGTAAVISLLAIAYALIPMPSGRRIADAAAHPVAAASGPGARSLLAGPLLLLGVAIATYVASEVGVSNWIVRFLEPAPLTTATLALSLFWAGLTVGRLVSSVIADRFDHLWFTVVCALGMAALVAVAVLAPALPLSIGAFAAAGAAAGPIFPMIVAIGGERYPERSAAVGGSLTGMAVIGSVVYPPAMGFLSVTIGLTAAMLGNVLLALACAAALVVFSRVAGRADARERPIGEPGLPA